MNALARQFFRVGSQCKQLVLKRHLREMTGGPLIAGCTCNSQEESKMGFRGRETPEARRTTSPLYHLFNAMPSVTLVGSDHYS